MEQTSLKSEGLLLKGALLQYTTGYCHGNLLCRYLMRTATHPKLRKDTDFINFLEDPNEVGVHFTNFSYTVLCSYQKLRRRQLSAEQDLCAL